MPCACKGDQPDYPITDNWGPSLWTILHALAEKAGRPIFPSFREDEKRQWTHFIEIMPKMIPCPNCREHAQNWVIAHPMKAAKDLGADEFHEWMVTWVYEFHEDVNRREGKPSFDKSLLSETYGSVNVKTVLKIMTPFIENAIRLSGITLFPWQKWNGYFKMLCSFYGI
jgi:hypothetical protein